VNAPGEVGVYGNLREVIFGVMIAPPLKARSKDY
jgi:hypothetical protein